MSTIDACPMKAFRQYILHLSSGYESTDLIAGGAFAKGAEVTRKLFYNEGYGQDTAIEIGQQALYEAYGDHIPLEGSSKTAEIVATALEQFFWQFPMDADSFQPAKLKDGGYAIEHHFSIELPIKHPDFGIPLHYFGRGDMLGTLDSQLLLEDDKTTGSYFDKNWASSWDTRGQFSAYCWALRKLGIPVVGALVRGISLHKTSIKFAETVTHRSQFMVDNWEVQFYKKLQAFIDCYVAYRDSDQKNPALYFNGAWNEACNAYFKPCYFKNLCISGGGEPYLADSYSQTIWLPHLQKQMDLDEYKATLNLPTA